MTRHRHGRRSGHALEILQACEMSEPRGLDNPITLLSVEPAIFNDESFLRIQQWVVFVSRQLEKSLDFRSLSVCSHFTNDGDTLRPILECKLRHHEAKQGCATCHPCLRCTRCRIEFTIQTRDLGVDDSAVIITKWARLGHGLSPTDPHWRSHALESFLWRNHAVVQAADDGSIHALFERQAKIGMDALLVEQASLLRRKAYRRVSLLAYKLHHPDWNDVWIRAPRVERNAHRYNEYPMGSYAY
jgi:hypothetical protein